MRIFRGAILGSVLGALITGVPWLGAGGTPQIRANPALYIRSTCNAFTPFCECVARPIGLCLSPRSPRALAFSRAKKLVRITAGQYSTRLFFSV
jgi:hypothetical protein